MFVDFEILILYIVLNLKWYDKSLTLKALILDVHVPVSAESCVPWLTGIVATVVTMSVDCFIIVVKTPSLIF